jgi:hypothetical protein
MAENCNLNNSIGALRPAAEHTTTAGGESRNDRASRDAKTPATKPKIWERFRQQPELLKSLKSLPTANRPSRPISLVAAPADAPSPAFAYALCANERFWCTAARARRPSRRRSLWRRRRWRRRRSHRPVCHAAAHDADQQVRSVACAHKDDSCPSFMLHVLNDDPRI